MMKAINSSLIASFFLLSIYSGCKSDIVPTKESEKIIEVQTGKETKIEFNNSIYVFTLTSVNDGRVPDCNLHYGSLLPAKLNIAVNKQEYPYEFFSCKPDDEFSWTELDRQSEASKLTKVINENTEFRVSKVSTMNGDHSNATVKIIVRSK